MSSAPSYQLMKQIKTTFFSLTAAEAQRSVTLLRTASQGCIFSLSLCNLCSCDFNKARLREFLTHPFPLSLQSSDLFHLPSFVLAYLLWKAGTHYVNANADTVIRNTHMPSGLQCLNVLHARKKKTSQGQHASTSGGERTSFHKLEQGQP